MAELAFPVHNIHLENIKVRSVDDPSIAGGAERRITRMARDISNVDIFETILPRNLISRFQGGDRGRREMGQFIIREEPCEMDRGIPSEILFHPPTHLIDHPWFVI